MLYCSIIFVAQYNNSHLACSVLDDWKLYVSERLYVRTGPNIGSQWHLYILYARQLPNITPPANPQCELYETLLKGHHSCPWCLSGLVSFLLIKSFTYQPSILNVQQTTSKSHQSLWLLDFCMSVNVNILMHSYIFYECNHFKCCLYFI